MKLLDQVRTYMQRKHYSPKTIKTYVHWIKRYIVFSGIKHPKTLHEDAVIKFLSHLAIKKHVAASTQNQALNALVLLYKQILHTPLGDLSKTARAKRPKRLPTFFTTTEVRQILAQLDGTMWLIVSLLYGSGLRLGECLSLRVKDINFEYKQITIRYGKGGKDRVTPLAEKLKEPLKAHLKRVKELHDSDLKDGFGRVALPFALSRKYPNASRAFAWQYVFPQVRRWVDKKTHAEGRHHVHETIVQRAIKVAKQRAGIHKHGACHAMRHYAELGIRDTVLPRIP